MANSCLRVKTNAEMLAEILPALAADVRRTGKFDLEDAQLARDFGATAKQVFGAVKLGRAQREVDVAARAYELQAEFEAAGWKVIK